ncbi:sensor histidine kinase [Actinomyces slackii]|uniref:sensor histidine kinase n=1 Tax=Actinomyces slackii TaxID=52774 RepID=UPI000418526A|nr:HAMP domain-containing sensor histidine kinase [Actinomyces slackii]
MTAAAPAGKPIPAPAAGQPAPAPASPPSSGASAQAPATAWASSDRPGTSQAAEPQEQRRRTPRWRAALWIGAVALLGLAVAFAQVAYGRTMVSLTASVPLLVLEAGLILLLIPAAVVAVRRLLARARDRARREAGREAWERHQQFLRRLDHELKNPLTAVRAAVADMPQASRAERKARLDVVDAQARRMGRLITDLRKLAELETAELAWEDVDLAETVTDAVEAVREEIAASGNHTLIGLDLPQVPWPLPHVRGDGDLLYSVIYNVVSNAAKYTPPGGSIEVRGREEAGTVTIEVADTGIGVPQGDMPVVWAELGRAGNARGLPGSGLGLPLVATIVRRHGGRATMSSKEGVGSRVWVSLPVAGPRQTGDRWAT